MGQPCGTRTALLVRAPMPCWEHGLVLAPSLALALPRPHSSPGAGACALSSCGCGEAGAGNRNPGGRLCKEEGPGTALAHVETPLALTEKPPGRIPDRGDSFPAGSNDFASPVNPLQPSRRQGQQVSQCPRCHQHMLWGAGAALSPVGSAGCRVLGCRWLSAAGSGEVGAEHRIVPPAPVPVGASPAPAAT